MNKSIFKLGTLTFLVAVLPYSLVESCRASVTHEDSGAGCKSWEEKGKGMEEGSTAVGQNVCAM